MFSTVGIQISLLSEKSKLGSVLFYQNNESCFISCQPCSYEIYTRLQTRTLHFAKYFIFCVIETHSTDNVNYFYLPPLAHGLIDSYTEPGSND